MGRASTYPDELRERAVRMVLIAAAVSAAVGGDHRSGTHVEDRDPERSRVTALSNRYTRHSDKSQVLGATSPEKSSTSSAHPAQPPKTLPEHRSMWY